MDSSGKEQEEGIVSPREWFNRNAKSYDDALSSTLALAENEVLFNWVLTRKPQYSMQVAELVYY